MRHEALTHEDYRAVVKEWVMRQPDDRRQVFGDWNHCIVGQFLDEYPQFRKHGVEFSYSFTSEPNPWNSTHTDSYYDPVTEKVHSASEALSAGLVFSMTSSTFGPVKEAMTKHPLWKNL